MATKVMNQPWLWKRFASASVESFVGVDGEPFLDVRGPTPVLRLSDGVTAGGHLVSGGASVGSGYAVPYFTYPLENGTAPARPVLEMSRYGWLLPDNGPNPHEHTQVQIATDAAFSNIVFDTGTEAPGGRHVDLEDEGITLVDGTTYYARVRYINGAGPGAWGGSPTVTGDPLVFQVSTTSAPDVLQLKEYPSAAEVDASFGQACSLSKDGKLLAVGSCNVTTATTYTARVFIYERVGTAWVEKQILTPPDGVHNREFGKCVKFSDSGNVLLVGEPEGMANDMYENAVASGVVYAYKLVGDTWTLIQRIYTGDPRANEWFGSAIDCTPDGRVIVVGAWNGESDWVRAGYAYIFEYDGEFWRETIRLIASYRAADDRFGWAVAISDDGNTVAVGAPNASVGSNGLGTQTGALYLYQRPHGTWQQAAVLTIPTLTDYEWLGYSLDMSYDAQRIAVGVRGRTGISANSGFNTGAVAVFNYVEGQEWNGAPTLLVPSVTDNLYMGHRLRMSIDGQTIVALADGGPGSLGGAFVFQRTAAGWAQVAVLTPNDVTDYTEFGYGLGLAGNGQIAVLGSPNDSVNGTDAGAIYTFI